MSVIVKLKAKHRAAINVAGLMSLLAVMMGLAATASNPAAPNVAAVNLARPPAYRLRVQVQADGGSPYVNLPPSTRNWEIEYEYRVPPLPSSATWDYTTGVVYQWGDVDFDAYGSRGKYNLSKYLFNQIVPQLFIGDVLSGNDAHYNPASSKLRTWAIQSQYYWQKDKTSYAQTGAIVSVNPGDKITTLISYDAARGEIVARISDNHISGPSGKSTITIDRPFPNQPSLFSSWSDFFNQAEAKSHDRFIVSHPALDVETYNLDKRTMCALLPFTIESVSIPGISSTPSLFAIQPVGGFTCTQSLATLDF